MNPQYKQTSSTCHGCKIRFDSSEELKQHQKREHFCQFCDKYFPLLSSLCFHYGREHRFCNRYPPPVFDIGVDGSNIDQHKWISDNHYICYPCQRDFASWLGYVEHLIQSPNHHYCRLCHKNFIDGNNLNDHFRSAHHYCEACDIPFSFKIGLKEHYCQSPIHIQCEQCDEGFEGLGGLRDHFVESPAHIFCPDCIMHFDSPKHLDAHLRSSRHRPKTIRCSLRNCEKLMNSVAALAAHFESSTCASGVNCNMLDKMICQIDINHMITDPSRMLTNGESGSSTTYYTTEASWNGSGFECYFCPKEFYTLGWLNTHLASPAHRAKVYICPCVTCQARFSTLSALCQHIESEKCGSITFKPMEDVMDRLFDGLKISA